MANKATVKLQADPAQLRGLYAAMRQMDDASKTTLKNEVTSISAWSAAEIRSNASASPFPAQAEKVAMTVRENKDRIPNVTIGGSRKVTSTRAEAGFLLFGAEFGGPSPFPNGGRRFPYRSANGGRAGYWIFPKLKQIQPELTRRWKSSVERLVIAPWGRNG